MSRDTTLRSRPMVQPRGELFVADRLHLNAEGYKLMADRIWPVLPKDLSMRRRYFRPRGASTPWKRPSMCLRNRRRPLSDCRGRAQPIGRQARGGQELGRGPRTASRSIRGDALVPLPRRAKSQRIRRVEIQRPGWKTGGGDDIGRDWQRATRPVLARSRTSSRHFLCRLDQLLCRLRRDLVRPHLERLWSGSGK